MILQINIINADDKETSYTSEKALINEDLLKIPISQSNVPS